MRTWAGVFSPLRVAIVGAGPTGLSAAYYLARRRYPVTICDAVPHYRLPRAKLQQDIEATCAPGATIHLNMAIGRDISLADRQEAFDAVLLAIGAQRNQCPGIVGEQVWHGGRAATAFLEECNLNPETTLTGSTALYAGGKQVSPLYRRTRTDMPAHIEEVRAAVEEGIELMELVLPVQLLSAERKLFEVRCLRLPPGEPDAQG